MCRISLLPNYVEALYYIEEHCYEILVIKNRTMKWNRVH
jgi:hypothetical protein